MGRNILGAFVGYVAMVIVAIAGIGLAWAVLGGEGAFDGEGPYPSLAWLATNLAFGFAGAVVGGWLARRIGTSAAAVKILVGAMLVIGIATALMAESSYAKRSAEAPVDKPVAELTFVEAGQVAKQPTWYNWVIPFVGAAGALLGGRERSTA